MLILLIVLLGLCLGSFVNALVWRVHELESNPKLSLEKRKELSVLNGRSICVHCRHTLSWFDLLPVAGWLSLAGKCRYCHKPISWQYPLVEIITTSLFLVSYSVWPYGFDMTGIILFVIWLVFLTGFMALAVYDIRWMQLPDRIVFPLIGLAVVHVGIMMIHSDKPVATLTGAILGFIAIVGLFYALLQLSQGKWIGGGDVKLALVIGPLIGSGFLSLAVIFIASLIGSVLALPFLINKSLESDSHIPFGPLLIVSTVIVYLYGTQIIDWYFNSLG